MTDTQGSAIKLYNKTPNESANSPKNMTPITPVFPPRLKIEVNRIIDLSNKLTARATIEDLYRV